ncbi:hypothetical protein [Ideonella sp. A 288]|uniref:hypothetical protein n=1 Tax=Ideonella sp. A 288 TaxID=1962181 RepID=UPI000B4B58C5|nr:hypothetical protein [Ideonella sp. A 288]
MSRIGWLVDLGRVAGWCLALLVACAPSARAAECPQITSWSTQDTAFFPVQRVTRAERSNTPGPNYFTLLGEQERTLRTTYFVMTAGPTLTVDRRFWNSVGVSLFSFASEADAKAMFRREYTSFFPLNDARWGYDVLHAEPLGLIAWYDKTPGAQEIQAIRLHRHTLISVVLHSATATETLQQGLDELEKRVVRAIELVEARCSGSSNIYAPTIAIEGEFGMPHQAGFQRRLAAGKLVIVATNQGGRDELDWSTFRLFVAGVDKTGHVLQLINHLASRGRLKHGVPDDQPNTESYELQLDPSQLTGDHNFFNIAFNGTWPVQLRLCNRSGLCGQTDYQLYFGPFLVIDPYSFEDRRCLDGSANGPILFKASWGNHGHSSVSNFYVALSPSLAPWESWVDNFYTLTLDLVAVEGKLHWMHSSYGVQPVFHKAPVDLPTGTLVSGYAVSTPSLAWNAGNRVLLGAGSHSLVYGAVDLSPGLGEGAAWLGSMVVRLCGPK